MTMFMRLAIVACMLFVLNSDAFAFGKRSKGGCSSGSCGVSSGFQQASSGFATMKGSGPVQYSQSSGCATGNCSPTQSSFVPNGYSLPAGYTIQNGCICAPGVCLTGNCDPNCPTGNCAPSFSTGPGVLGTSPATFKLTPDVKPSGTLCVDGKCYTVEQFNKKFNVALTSDKDGSVKPAWADPAWKK